jgi:hypothetical protein
MGLLRTLTLSHTLVFFPGDWHMECLTGQLSDLQSLNFSLGNVKQLSLVHCGNNLSIPYADLLRSWSVQGLEELRIDMGEKSISRPLMTQAFIGLQELYPGLDLASFSSTLLCRQTTYSSP